MNKVVWKNKSIEREKLTRQLSEKASEAPNPKNMPFNIAWQNQCDELLELELALGAAGAKP